jgi:DNA-binding LytR/AlgR family response regulator
MKNGAADAKTFPDRPARIGLGSWPCDRAADARGKDESQTTIPQPCFPIKLKNPTPLLVACPERSEGLPTPADQSESVPTIFYRDDFVLLTDDIKSWIVRIEDISLLEAWRNFTLVHFPDGKLLIRRSLGHCERRLDTSIFFRASRGCIVNFSHVKQSRLNKDGGLVFVLRDGKEVMLSRRQTVLFRTARGL